MFFEHSNKTAVLILGMHRSGTSSLAGSLEQRGLYLGKVAQSNINNPKGNRENREIMALNDYILRKNKGSWDRPPEKLYYDDTDIIRKKAIIEQLINGTDSFWGFKDPRSLITLDFWREGLEQCMYVATFRHPYSVAFSLQNRNGIPPKKGLELWNYYNKKLIELSKKENLFLVNFDLSHSEYIRHINKISQIIGLPGMTFEENSEFYTPTLINHHKGQNDYLEQLPEEVIITYSYLLDYHLSRS